MNEDQLIISNDAALQMVTRARLALLFFFPQHCNAMTRNKLFGAAYSGVFPDLLRSQPFLQEKDHNG